MTTLETMALLVGAFLGVLGTLSVQSLARLFRDMRAASDQETSRYRNPFWWKP